MPEPNRRLGRSLFWMVAVALAIRLMVMGIIYERRLDPKEDHFAFGYETGRIAAAIASNEGFSSPFHGKTGPTAWLPPLYPYLLAGIFKVLGVYSRASVLVILGLQDLFSALTCLPIFFLGRRIFGDAEVDQQGRIWDIGRKCFGTTVAHWAGWAWALFPYAIYLSNRWIWENSLSALLLSLLVLLTLHLQSEPRLRSWLGYGLLWGLAALTNPVVLSGLPFLWMWLWWRHWQRGARCGQLLGASALVFVLTLAPWAVRNYLVFHRFLPLRSNFGFEVHIGNNALATKRQLLSIHPTQNRAELESYQRMGELAYVAEKKQKALQYIAAYPGIFVWRSFRRAVYVWTCFWDIRLTPSGSLRLALRELLNILFCTSLSIFAFMGLLRLSREGVAEAVPCWIVLILFPMIYYVTGPHPRYRHPIDPLILVLAAYAVCKSPQPRGPASAEPETPTAQIIS